MGRGVYTVSFENQAFTNANGDYDFFELTPASNKPLEVIGLFIGNVTELGDAQEEQVRWAAIRGHATSGNGTSTTPRPVDASDGAASFTAETVGSTIASAGTAVNLHQDTFNIRTGLQLILPPEMRWKVSAAETTLVVRMLSTLTDDANLSGTLYVREL